MQIISFLQNLDMIVLDFIGLLRSYGTFGIFLSDFFAGITSLAGVIAVATITVSVCMLWWVRSYHHYIRPFLCAVIGTEASVFLLKIFFGRERPNLLSPLAYETSASFPSAHAAIAVALYGFFAYFIWQELIKNKKRRRGVEGQLSLSFLYLIIVVKVATLIIFLIAFSRLYLGVHYLSDVVGGMIIGGLWLWGSVRTLPLKKK